MPDRTDSVEANDEYVFTHAVKFRLKVFSAGLRYVMVEVDTYPEALKIALPIWKRQGRLLIYAVTEAGDAALVPQTKINHFARLWLNMSKRS